MRTFNQPVRDPVARDATTGRFVRQSAEELLWTRAAATWLANREWGLGATRTAMLDRAVRNVRREVSDPNVLYGVFWVDRIRAEFARLQGSVLEERKP